MNKRYVIVIVILILLSSFLFIPSGEAESVISYDKGHTGLHGRTTQEDSNFIFELSGPYWYRNLDIWLETWENESEYRIYVNDELVDEGTILEGKTYKNYTLPDNRPVDLIVEIDNYTYNFRQKLITGRDHNNWTPPEKDKDGEFYTPGELTQMKLLVWAQGLIGIAIVTPISYWLAKKKKESQITEVIE